MIVIVKEIDLNCISCGKIFVAEAEAQIKCVRLPRLYVGFSGAIEYLLYAQCYNEWLI